MTVTLQRPAARGSVPHDHVVQFYERDDFLTRVVAEFLGDGLGAGEPAVIIATEAHRRGFAARLSALGFDVERASATGQLTLLDAEETLGTFMVDGMPDWERFSATIGAALARVSGAGSGRVRAYGEMVDVLWRQGSRTAAVVLEEMWNELGRTHAFSLLCAYVVSSFYQASDDDQHDVRTAHSHVLPAETDHPRPGPAGPAAPAGLAREHVRALAAEIEHRKEVERALRDALHDRARLIAELQETVRVNERFTAILGHDLRTPLSAIMASAQLAVRLGGALPALAKPLGRVVSSGGRMTRMIDQLLDFARLRLKQGMPVEPVAVDLLALVRAAIDELSGEGQRIQLEHAGATAGSWDPDRLSQVLSNIIGNALHHGAAGSPVRVRLDGTDAERVKLEVQNRGAIPPELLPRVFEPFVGERSRRSPQGLGLGLYITREIAQAHGGRVDVASSEAEGTTFVVTLPRVAASRA